jgi:hypothetical protein
MTSRNEEYINFMICPIIRKQAFYGLFSYMNLKSSVSCDDWKQCKAGARRGEAGSQAFSVEKDL